MTPPAHLAAPLETHRFLSDDATPPHDLTLFFLFRRRVFCSGVFSPPYSTCLGRCGPRITPSGGGAHDLIPTHLEEGLRNI